MRVKLGHKLIAAMQPHTILWDEAIRGFCARRQFSDVITFSVAYRTQDGIARWQKIGRYGVFTPEQARQEAARILREVALGADPSALRHERRHGMTVEQLCDEYAADMDAGRISGKKDSTIKSDKSRIAAHIKPKLGKHRVAAITSEQVEDFMRDMSSGSARRNVGLLGAIFSYAVKRKLRPDNPVHGIDKPADVKRMRRLSEGEYAQLGTALNRGASVAPIAASVVKLLALTGWRSSEAKNLRWSELDLPRQIATLGDTKTGLSVRPLSKIAVEIIEAQPRKDAFVFSYERGRPISNLRPHWLNLRMPKDVTPHSLRHSFASLAGDMGLPDHTIARMLGHRQSSITSRYIHMEKAVIEASDLVAAETMRLMKG